ncbi:carboxypeptidase regulatory-like domain-containing protein, partial [bacterium]|nr:carboxypeptidase regulatory-like domain-containing protein [bacterium]
MLRITLIVLLTLTVFGGFAEVVEDSTEESAPPRDTLLQDYIALHKGEFQGIYEDFLLTEPELAGRVVVEVTLRDGLAADAVVIENDTGSEELGEAIVAGFESWCIAGLSGDVIFVLPLVFQPSDGELATLEGRAYDEDGNPYEGATVTVSGVDFWAETDADGYYTISGIPAGSYYVYCMTVDYLEAEASDVVLEGNSVVTLDFTDFYVMTTAEKPNIYLYPIEETEVSVRIDFPRGGRITVSDPKYLRTAFDLGWQKVTASPDGMLSYRSNEYGFLFYESQNPLPESYGGSWVVEQPELEGFFRENLSAHGFVGREIEDFVEYWIPRLTDSPWYSLRPLYKEELAEVIRLQIEPEPDSLLRLIYVIRGLDAVDGDPTPPVIPDFERTGFTVAEWGGIVEGEWFDIDENGTIRGVVRDWEQEPIVGVRVEVIGTGYHATTDGDGRFLVEEIPPGVYFVSCKAAGYHTDTSDKLSIRAGRINGYGTVMTLLKDDPAMYCAPCYKPNIYLYPTEEIDVSVQLSFPAGGEVTVSDPDYGDGWDVSITPDGTITSGEGEHSFLFYESLNADKCQREQGWVVPRAGLEEFFRQNLTTTGFYEQEIEDFIEFWIPRLLSRPWYAVYPQYNAEYGEMVELHVDPAPHSLIRLVYLVAGLDEEMELMPALIPAFEIGGFTVHEWGVMLAEEMEEPLLGSIHGTVMDESNVPIELAWIKILDTELSTTTDEDGYYTIENIPPATYDILCTVAGFEDIEMPGVVIESGDRRTINYTMVKPDDVTGTGKPNIYLYPTEETDVSVQLSFPEWGEVTVSDP